MLSIVWIFGFLGLLAGLCYYRVKLLLASALMALLLAVWCYFSQHYGVTVVLACVLLAVGIPLNYRPLRRRVLSAPLFRLFRKLLPTMSSTEQQALTAGSVWWEGELFSGKPNFSRLLHYPQPALTTEEKAFIAGPVEQLCHQVSDWQVMHEYKDLPAETWQFLREQGFFGLVIPKRYGGLGFSPYAYARIVEKAYNAGVTLGTTVGVPSSLGPAELLLRYGTPAQQDYYLPRLASGEAFPCFALTSADAGSDASSMTDYGLICESEIDGETVLGIRLTFNKRYITFAPIATLIGLAFILYDPDHHLGEKENLGITCALIPRDTQGIEIGRRHLPANNPFQNGPIIGNDVFIPLDYIIGGQKMIGQGWRMLMECLAAGRATCLPASAVAANKVAAMTTGAYARIRKQFQRPIGYFEGVEEVLTQIAAATYWTEAGFKFTLGALNSGEHPPVCSGIIKYQLTEAARQTLNHAMDVQAGKAIMMGPRNFLSSGTQGAAIGITVEGSNILTRSMIVFGQGAIRCHPYLLAEMQAVQETDQRQGLITFDDLLWRHVGFLISNSVRSLWLGLTGARVTRVPRVRKLRRYYQRLSRYSANFALLADTTMLRLGGELKRREKLSGRFADSLSQLYLLSAVLKRYHDDGYPVDDLALIEWCCQDAFYTIEQQFDGILRNLPQRGFAAALRALIFPLGRQARKPSDQLGKKIAKLLLSPNPSRERLLAHSFQPAQVDHKLGLLERVLQLSIKTEQAEKRVNQAYRRGEINGLAINTRIHAAMEAGLIISQEANDLLQLEPLRQAILTVDDFNKDFSL